MVLLTLQFIYGDGTSNHLTSLMQKAQQHLAQPNHQVIFIVPNYNKFEREIEILKAYQQLENTREFSSTNLQIFSFQRLAWFYTQKLPVAIHHPLQSVTKEMILRQVLIETSEQLRIYRGEIMNQGFIQQVLDLFNEFENGRIQMQQLQVSNESTQHAELADKLAELQIIYQAFVQKCLDFDFHYETVYQQFLNILAELSSETSTKLTVNEKQQLKAEFGHTLFIVTGFSDFTSEEFELLQHFMGYGQLCIDLLIDNPKKALSPLDVFYPTSQTYQRLIEMAKENQCKILLDEKVKEPANEWQQTIHQIWMNVNQNAQFDISQAQTFSIARVENPQEELRRVAVKIKQLLQQGQGNLRLRDIQIFAPDLSIYQPFLQYTFDEAGIPFFVDTPQLMNQHPLTDLLKSLFAFHKYHFRFTDVLHFFKTELFILDDLLEQEDLQLGHLQMRRMIDELENVVLAYHYQGNDWVKEEDWVLPHYNFEDEKDISEEIKSLQLQVNQLRQAFQQNVTPFVQKLKSFQTFGEAITTLYQWFIDCHIDREILYFRDEELANGHLEKARLHEQSWQALMDIFDQFYDIYKDTPFDLDLFEAILFSAIDNYEFSQIPATIDQLKVNRLELIRANQTKVSFILGLKEGAFPRKFENKTLLSDEERDILANQLEHAQQLGANSKSQSLKESFIAYNAWLSGSQQVYLSYPMNYDNSQNLKPSFYLSRLAKQLNLNIETYTAIQPQVSPSDYLVSPRALIRQLNVLYRLTQESKQALPTVWEQLKDYLLKSNQATLAKQIFRSLNYHNTATSLAPEQPSQLYQNNLYSSISSLETFYSCQYRYFLNYGLKVRERQEQILSPALTGSYFHDALDQIVQQIISQTEPLTQEKQAEILEKVLIKLLGDSRYEIFARSKRMVYIRQQLEKTIKQMYWVIRNQQERGLMQFKQTELVFGHLAGAREAHAKGLTIDLNDKHHLHLRGKIDRIDLFNRPEEAYVSVVDYKSGNKQFDLTEFYNGLSMQLITYLEVAINYVKEELKRDDIKPLGAYYLHVYRPKRKFEEATETDLLKKYKYEGLFISEEQAFEVMDAQLENKENSYVFPLRKNKDGQLGIVSQSKNKFYTNDEMKQLFDINHRNMQQAGNTIYEGHLEINPSLHNNKRACQTCPFKSICQFDALLPENRYRIIEKAVRDEILTKEDAPNA